MSLSLGNPILDERTVPVVVGQDPVTGKDVTVLVVYVPSQLTPVVEAAANRLYSMGLSGSGTARLLSGMIKDWWMVDADGHALEPEPNESELKATYEDMLRVPIPVLGCILDALLADVRQEKETLKNSGGGSRATAKSGRAQDGTPLSKRRASLA
jgi:hypothetical protein